MENITCGYDGFKLFIPGQAAINHLVANFKQFNLYGRYKIDDENNYQLPLPLKGEYQRGDYKLTITATKYNGEAKYKGGQEGQ
ncbi:MAG: hypothetical protein JWQ09_2994 [Segetibacter sp.]|nr:hypothetical protein [Segetibacter sp.]